MIYLVTGASGFIGKRLVRTLLSRPGSTVYFLMRDVSPARIDNLRAFWNVDETRAIPILGDLNKIDLGISAAERQALSDKVDHVFHLAAVYDLNAEPEVEMTTNIAGTRNAINLVKSIRAKQFHHMSSIAAAGLYEGVFREDMFEEACNLDHPYFASKHESEKVVRNECQVPWRVYRPGIVVGDSRNGEMDKIDGQAYPEDAQADAALDARHRHRRGAPQSRPRRFRRSGVRPPSPSEGPRRALLPSHRYASRALWRRPQHLRARGPCTGNDP
jgi:thioester reductase-like protein